MANTYWKARAARNEAYAQKIAGVYSHQLKKLHNQSYSRLNTYLSDLMNDVQSGKIASRSELWRSKKYIDLLNQIEQETGVIATAQQQAVRDCLENVFTTTMGRTMADFGREFNLASDTLKQKLINSVWSGKDFSTRIWTNTHALAARLKEDMSEMILSGQDIHKILMDDMSVSYHEADKLIRTESAHIFTEASKETYRQANVQDVEWIGERDDRICEECAQYRGKSFPLDKAPLLPVHPNCRCCLAPIIKINPTN